MKKNNGFLGSLQKSTKVTLISCISFILLTLLILVFFIFFPITPSEKIMASIGRENIFNNNPQNSVTSAFGAVTSTSSSTTTVGEEYTGTTTRKTYNIVITTGSGFMWNGQIPAGITNTNTSVILDEPQYSGRPPYTVSPPDTTDENNYVPEIPDVTTTPIDTDIPSTDVPVWTEPPIDTDVPVWTEPPVVTDAPVWTEPPVNTDVPVWTEPPVIIDTPPVVDPDPNGGGSGYNEW